MLRMEIAQALEPYPNAITNFIIKEMDGMREAQEYLSIAFDGATMYEK